MKITVDPAADRMGSKNAEREAFFATLASDYAAMKSDPTAWQAELEEESAWAPSLDDGLADEQSESAGRHPREA